MTRRRFPRLLTGVLVVLLLTGVYFGLWEITKRYTVRQVATFQDIAAQLEFGETSRVVETSPGPLIIKKVETGPSHHRETIDLWLFGYRWTIYSAATQAAVRQDWRQP